MGDHLPTSVNESRSTVEKQGPSPFPNLPLELVHMTFDFFMELDQTPHAAAVMASVDRYMHHRATKRLYTKITITRYAVVSLLNRTLKSNDQDLASMIKILVMQISKNRRSNSGEFAYSDNHERWYDYPYNHLSLRSLVCSNSSLSRGHVSQYHLTHLIHKCSDSYLASLTPTNYPRLTHMATIMHDSSDLGTILHLIGPEGLPLRFLVVVLPPQIADLVEADMRAATAGTSVLLLPLVLPDSFRSDFSLVDASNILKILSAAHFDGSLWDLERCKTDVVLKGLVKEKSKCRLGNSP